MSAPDDARGLRPAKISVRLSTVSRWTRERRELARDLATLRERYEVLRALYVDALRGRVLGGKPIDGLGVDRIIDAELARRREGKP